MFSFHHKKYRYALWLTLVGMLLFVVFYSLAAWHYPGGSYNEPSQTGFHLKDNYLCDLLDTQTVNGLDNSASLYARIALGILCISLMVLWFYLPKLFSRKTKALLLMRWAGMLAMGITLLLASQNHDTVVRIAGVFGTIALLLALAALCLDGYKGLFVLGSLCLFLFLSNYFIYESLLFLKQLPVIQKITFTACILWFILLDIALIKKFRKP